MAVISVTSIVSYGPILISHLLPYVTIESGFSREVLQIHS